MNDKLYSSIRTGEKITWKEIYKNEDALIKDLKNINAKKYKDMNYKGYQYIESFIGQIKRGEELSSKQITQAKRLAKYIKLYSIEQS